jgi:hypothetical protein
VLLASFVDQYGTPFNVGPQNDDADAYFFDANGFPVTQQPVPVQINGVLLTNLQALAGGATLASSGKVFIDVEPGNGNSLGLFGQALGTFAEGQRMPAVAEVPVGNTNPTPPTPTPVTTTPTPGPGGACTRALLTVQVSYDEKSVIGSGRLEGLTVDIGYPATLSLPGTLSDPSVTERVMNLTGLSSALLSVADNDANPSAAAVSVGLVSIGTTIPPGDLASIDFDCQAGTNTPPTTSFTCSAFGADAFGLPIAAENFDCVLTIAGR